MNAPLKIPMPLRVPELAPSLGRLLVPNRLIDPWVPLDDVREELVTRIIEMGGEARGAAAREQRERVVETLGRQPWLAAWERAVHRAADRVAEALDQTIEHTARRVRMPQRQWRRRLLAGGERRAIAARLGSGAERFVAALDALDDAAGRARQASVLEKDAHAQWQEALRAAARRLEAAWLALEDGVAAEARRWAPEIEAIAAWHPSLLPTLAVWTPLTVAGVWLGLVLGGVVPAPPWLAAALGF